MAIFFALSKVKNQSGGALIGIINYRAGNLQNLQNALTYLGATSTLLDQPGDLANYSKLILPGVGAFGHAMANLKHYGFIRPIRRAAQENKTLLGICLGMQLLFDFSDEDGGHPGLGLIPGKVTRFDHEGLKIPHMGWNNANFTDSADPLVSDLRPTPWFYFVHSYACHPANPQNQLGVTEYGEPFCSIVKRNSLYGVQFHPEKSQADGLALLHNFIRLEV